MGVDGSVPARTDLAGLFLLTMVIVAALGNGCVGASAANPFYRVYPIIV